MLPLCIQCLQGQLLGACQHSKLHTSFCPVMSSPGLGNLAAPVHEVQCPDCHCRRASGICARYVKADLPLLDAQSSHAGVFVALAIVAGIGVLSFLFLIISVAINWQMRKRLQRLERQQWYAAFLHCCSCMPDW